MMTRKINDLAFVLERLWSPTESSHVLNFVTISPLSTFNFRLKTCTQQWQHISPLSLFFNLLFQVWNSLPSLDISLPFDSINHFSKSFLRPSHFLQNFNPSNPCTFHVMCPCSKCLLTTIPFPISNLASVDFPFFFSRWYVLYIITYLADQSSIGRASVHLSRFSYVTFYFCCLPYTVKHRNKQTKD